MRKLYMCLCASLLFSIFMVSCRTGEELSGAPFYFNDPVPAQQTNSFVFNGMENNGNLRSAVTADGQTISTLQIKYAQMLGVLPANISNFALYQFIDEWYGVKYRLGGEDKTGVDCSAFAQRLYEQVFCVNIFRTAWEQFTNGYRLGKTDTLKEGDLVFFHPHSRKVSKIGHVGIYLMNNYFVHASSSQGVMISNLKDYYWSRYYSGAKQVAKN